MSPLERLIRDRIAENGPIPVSKYMELALAHPEHGYYMAKEPFGTSGDFVTAPEISQVFGELIGLWSAVAWQQMDHPVSINIIECGPGRGTLMKDYLRAADMVPDFRQAIDLYLVETSPALREVQNAALEGKTPQWHNALDEIPAGPSILIANEFLDALPICQLEKTPNGWAERLVGTDGEKFYFLPGDIAENTADIVPRSLKDAPDRSVFEYSPAILSFADTLSRRLAGAPGYALLIDYGHDRPGTADTLQAVREHAYHPALADPGSADLTAHVDFAAVRERFLRNNTQVFGPVAQGDFLASLGIRERTEKLCQNAAAGQAATLRSATDRLISANRMGTLFRVMVAGSEGLPPPPGFESCKDKEC